MTSSEKTREIVSWLVTALVLGGLVAFLALSRPPAMAQAQPTETDAVVRVTGPRELRIAPRSSLESKLVVTSIRQERTTSAVLEVTGTVTASLRRGAQTADRGWQFASPDLLAAYVDWQKAGADVVFTKQQLGTAEKLHETKIRAQARVVERMSKLVEAGSDSPKDLAIEETALQEAQLEGQKVVHEASAATRTAERAQAALHRQLEQAGLDPELLSNAPAGSVLLVADVPESKIERAREGQAARAHFYGVAAKSFTGIVNRIAPTVTREQRTLRVLVVLADGGGELRPGMFADVGIGTDERAALWAPADGVLHVGRADYLLASGGDGRWALVEVVLGETTGADVEVLRGAEAGARVLGAGAILLKPFAIEALAAR